MGKKKNSIKKFGAVALSATMLAGGILPSVGHAESNQASEVNDQELSVDIAAFEQLVLEVASGEITNEAEAENRLAELDVMNLPPKLLLRGSSSNYGILSQAKEVAAAIIAVGAFDTAKAKTDADKAAAAASSSGFSGLHNGKADAYRHSYWNALMSKSIGTTQAKKVADNHEKYSGGPKIEQDMDYYNNSKGRNIYSSMKSLGVSTSEANIKTRVKNDINKGSMKYIKSGKLVWTTQ